MMTEASDAIETPTTTRVRVVTNEGAVIYDEPILLDPHASVLTVHAPTSP